MYLILCYNKNRNELRGGRSAPLRPFSTFSIAKKRREFKHGAAGKRRKHIFLSGARDAGLPRRRAVSDLRREPHRAGGLYGADRARSCGGGRARARACKHQHRDRRRSWRPLPASGRCWRRRSSTTAPSTGTFRRSTSCWRCAASAARSSTPCAMKLRQEAMRRENFSGGRREAARQGHQIQP